MKIPMAPGLGLLLERPIFDTFNRKLGKSNEAYDPIDFSSVQAEMDRFKEDVIYPTIIQSEKLDYTFKAFLRSVDNFKEGYPYLNPEGIVPDCPADFPVGISDEPELGSEAEG